MGSSSDRIGSSSGRFPVDRVEFTVRIPRDLYEKLVKWSSDQERSLNSAVAWSIKNTIEPPQK